MADTSRFWIQLDGQLYCPVEQFTADPKAMVRVSYTSEYRTSASRVIAHAFMLLLGFSCCGITAHLPRAAFGTESEAEMEEVESRELCCSQSRSDSRRSSNKREERVDRPTGFQLSARIISSARPVVIGHRISIDNLAPIRC